MYLPKVSCILGNLVNNAETRPVTREPLKHLLAGTENLPEKVQTTSKHFQEAIKHTEKPTSTQKISEIRMC